MSTQSIFSIEDTRSLFIHWRNWGPKKPRALAPWSKRLGYKSPRVLQMILQGKRLPSVELLFKVCRQFALTDLETRYAELLLIRDRELRSRRAPSSAIEEELRAFRFRANPTPVEIIGPDPSALISAWYYLVIRQLALGSGFIEDPRWVSRRLGGAVPVRDCARVLKLLRELPLLRSPIRLRTTDDVASRAVRMHHLGMLDRAKVALSECSILEREFIGNTIRCSPKSMPRIKRALREFADRFETEFHDPAGTEVYQLNLQAFAHTRSLEERT